MLQARLLRPYTEKYFRSAGLAPGMRVLDLGSGVGDVSLLCGDIVGPAGRVLGLDRDAAAVERARRRTMEQGCSSWVSFEVTNLDDFVAAERFDAVVGRYVLLYQRDPATTIRRFTAFVEPGGIVAFHELDFTNTNSTFPPCERFNQAHRLLAEIFRRSGAPPDFGRRLGRTFLDAGLPFPTIVAESPVGGGPRSFVYPWIAGTLLNVAPRMSDLGIEVPREFALDDTLAQRLEEEAVELGAQLMGPVQYGAWARKLD